MKFYRQLQKVTNTQKQKGKKLFLFTSSFFCLSMKNNIPICHYMHTKQKKILISSKKGNKAHNVCACPMESTKTKLKKRPKELREKNF